MKVKVMIKRVPLLLTISILISVIRAVVSREMDSLDKSVKGLSIIFLLTIYPIAELTRVIICDYYNTTSDFYRWWGFLFEMGMMWAGYILAFLILGLFFLKRKKKR